MLQAIHCGLHILFTVIEQNSQYNATQLVSRLSQALPQLRQEPIILWAPGYVHSREKQEATKNRERVRWDGGRGREGEGGREGG